MGSAAHAVLLYDLRQPREPLASLGGHRKAVAYVRYAGGGGELVSASTDNSLRVWDVARRCCTQTLRGHVNEKNFVGLATDGQYIACGSETNELFLYCKGIGRPLLHAGLSRGAAAGAGAPGSMGGAAGAAGGAAPSHHFVSAVAWRRSSNMLVAANSLGSMWMLELV